jgi:hypothetical protein
MIKLQGFLLILSLALVLYSFIDCARREDHEIKKLPKWGWERRERHTILYKMLVTCACGLDWWHLGDDVEQVNSKYSITL